jgi:S-formylglutathione hydrolase FrmB
MARDEQRTSLTSTIVPIFALLLLLCGAILAAGQTTSLRFEVSLAKGVVAAPQKGRLFVFINPKNDREPRFDYTNPGLFAPPLLARDIENMVPGSGKAVIDQTAISHPVKLGEILPGDYFVQAVLDTNIDSASLNAPGNLYSAVQKVSLDPAKGGTVTLELNNVVPPEQLPANTDLVKYVKIQSALLSKFHGRPIFLRAGIILPRDYERDSASRYPLLIRIGGYGGRFTRAGQLMAENSDFRGVWLADDTPRMIYVTLDGDGPYGDPYQINSANNGPYGDAVTQELIPAIEKQFRAYGKPRGRFLTGGSTGGWVSTALQIFYPDYFNGSWSGSPDPFDFRAYQLVNIYKDDNAYLNADRFERPSARLANGDTQFTMRVEVLKENVMGAGDSYVMSGSQWGAWNAVFSPRGVDGKPVPLWDPKTGKIDHSVAEQWKKYDLRIVAEKNWVTLAPKIKGKLHIWVGEEDDYFLNNAVHLFEDFLLTAKPSFDGWVKYNRTGRHGWSPLTQAELIKDMQRRFEETQD